MREDKEEEKTIENEKVFKLFLYSLQKTQLRPLGLIDLIQGKFRYLVIKDK